MSDLSFVERNKLEKLLCMGSGYVLNFSNRTFQEFFAESVNIVIYDSKYENVGSSKANRLRAFWKLEPNHIVGKVIQDLVEMARPTYPNNSDNLLQDCIRIAERLRQGAAVLEELGKSSELGERAFQALEKSLRQAIDNNEPETALDRLHTYVIKYMRSVCRQRGLETSRDKPLHSLVGEYVKHMKAAGLIESEMTERILKSSISIMEAFNRVRNEQSLAHDNPILNYSESLLIFNHIVSALRFIESLERPELAINQAVELVQVSEEIPF